METVKLAAFRDRALNILFLPQCLCCQALVAETVPCAVIAGKIFLLSTASRDFIFAFKHGDWTHAVAAYVSWLNRTGRNFIQHTDIVLPVPLHWSRLFYRRYNQAALLVIELGKLTALPVDTDSLVRDKRTAPQGHKSPNQRLSNLRGAFFVSAQSENNIKDQHVLLIDDVLTTGATAAICTETLLRAGTRNVDVLTLARVVLTEPANSDTSPSDNGLLTDIWLAKSE